MKFWIFIMFILGLIYLDYKYDFVAYNFITTMPKVFVTIIGLAMIFSPRLLDMLLEYAEDNNKKKIRDLRNKSTVNI